MSLIRAYSRVSPNTIILQIYHVVRNITAADLCGIGLLRRLDFELKGLDLQAYILAHLRKTVYSALDAPSAHEEKAEKLKHRFERMKDEIQLFVTDGSPAGGGGGNLQSPKSPQQTQHSLSDMVQVMFFGLLWVGVKA